MAEGGGRAGGGLEFIKTGLKTFGNKLESVATNVASGVATGVTTVGTGVISAAKDLKDTILDNEIDRIRAINQFAKAQNYHKTKAKYTESELNAADIKANEVLAKLYTGYFDEGFDPIRHELSKLTDLDAQDNIDSMVDHLTQGVETVSGKLARHVVKKREQLLSGIDTVAKVEGDLKAALATTRTARLTLSQASQEVQQHLRVISQTRRKQQYLQLAELCSRIKQVRNLQKSLRLAQDSGEYADAILLCVQCFHRVESMQDLKVSAELLSTVQRLYVDTLSKLNTALTAICGAFYPLRYSKVSSALAVGVSENMDGHSLAERVLQCFKDHVHDATGRVVKSVLITQTMQGPQPSSMVSLEGSYTSLLSSLPTPVLGQCMSQLME
ncbi:uncharacterized protein HaLaN_17478, partial [Haematococcus lacustris]